MFVVDAAVVLPHPPHRVARVTGRLQLLPRWCAGLRRVRYPAPAPAVGCVFTYAFTHATADVRLTLVARTLAEGAEPEGAHPAGTRLADDAVAHTPVSHAASGDGLTLTWTLSAEPTDEAGVPAAAAGDAFAGADAWGAAPSAVAARPHTRLRAHVALSVDPGYPLSEARTALCRTVARRVPADLERLRTLLERYEGERASPPTPWTK